MSECKFDLGPMAAKLAELQRELDRAKRERDEARREVCRWAVGRWKPLFPHYHTDNAKQFASAKGWDCWERKETDD